MHQSPSRYVKISLLTAALGALPAEAIDFFWNVAGPADWNVGTNWNPEGPPSGGGGNHARINNGGTAVISADIADFQDIFVGQGAGNTGTLNQTAGETFQGTGSWMFVGQEGTGTYNLSGGTANKERLYVGQNAGGMGFLNVSGTGVVGGGGGELNVGVGGGFGTATFTENAVVNTGLIQFANANVSVTDNTSMTAGGEFWVGNGGGNSAVLDMDSGNIEAGSWIAIGRDSSTGVVNLSGTARLALVGPLPVDNQPFITIGGLGAGGSGTLNISGDAVVDNVSGMVLSETSGRTGIVNQSGGTVNLVDFIHGAFGDSLEVDGGGGGGGAYNLSGGTLNAQTIDASTGTFNMTGGTLNATNYIGNFAQAGGSFSPGMSPGTATVAGNYSLVGGELVMDLDGLTAGSEYDQLIVTGDVSLSGSLAVLLGYSAALGDMFTIVDNQGANPITGTFTEGSEVSTGPFDFAIDYEGGDGNDVVLTVIGIPEPSTLTALAGGLLLLAGRRRRTV